MSEQQQEEFGPIYGVKLINSMAIAGSGFFQQMPSRRELEEIRRVSQRLVAAYELLLWNHHQAQTILNGPEGVDLVLAHRIAGFLNGLLPTDEAAITAIVEHRVPCSEQIAVHPTIQVGCEVSGAPRLGVLGLLNGLCGAYPDGNGAIIAGVRNGQIKHFAVVTSAEGGG
jgi:hypothetical protein